MRLRSRGAIGVAQAGAGPKCGLVGRGARTAPERFAYNGRREIVNQKSTEGEDNAKKIIVFLLFVYSKLYIFLFTFTTVSRRPTNYYETSGHPYKSCFANFETISKYFLSKFNSFIVLYSFYLFLYASPSFSFSKVLVEFLNIYCHKFFISLRFSSLPFRLLS
jgi:hypothetical protein